MSRETVGPVAPVEGPKRKSPFRQNGLPLILKRGVDLVASSIGLIILSPALAAIAILIRVTMGTPVLFRQLRPGRHGQPFTILKFRTMSAVRDSQGRLLPDEFRLTPLGRFLRSSSLDELPQLLNVFKGELSLVGPRPLLMKYMTLYSARQLRRHNVMPGITGWAQVCGRNQLSWDEKLELDAWYAEHWSNWLDVKILFKTVGSVIKSEGISQEGSATMPEFMGSTEGNLNHSEMGPVSHSANRSRSRFAPYE